MTAFATAWTARFVIVAADFAAFFVLASIWRFIFCCAACFAVVAGELRTSNTSKVWVLQLSSAYVQAELYCGFWVFQLGGPPVPLSALSVAKGGFGAVADNWSRRSENPQ